VVEVRNTTICRHRVPTGITVEMTFFLPPHHLKSPKENRIRTIPGDCSTFRQVESVGALEGRDLSMREFSDEFRFFVIFIVLVFGLLELQASHRRGGLDLFEARAIVSQ